MKKDKNVMAVIIGIVCILLVAIMFAQFKTIEETDIAGIRNAREEELQTMIATLKTRYEETNEKLQETNQKIAEYTTMTQSTQETENLLSKELSQTNMLVGKTDVTGDGVVITLSDNQNKQIEYTDLIKLVNELKLAGAEAISINDQRIVNMTDIVMVNDIMLINSERVISPYIIRAIGDQTYLSSALSLKNSGYIDKMTSSGKTASMTLEKNIKILAYSGGNNLMELRYAKEVQQ